MSASAQYSDISYSGETPVKLVHIDQTDSCTLFFFQCAAVEDFDNIKVNDEMQVVLQGSGKAFTIKTSANVPMSHNAEIWTRLDPAGKKLNFILAFDKIPLNQTFDIVDKYGDNKTQILNFKNIKVNMDKVSEKYDIKSFLDATPACIQEIYYVDGKTYTATTYKGITLTARFVDTYDAGHVNKVILDIVNNTSHAVDFRLKNVSVVGYRDGNVVEMKILTPDRYEQKITNRMYNNYYGAHYTARDVARQASKVTWGSGSDKQSVEVGAVELLVYLGLSQRLVDYGNYLEKTSKILTQQYIKDNTLRSGECYGGYFNMKHKTTDYYIFSINLDRETFRIHVNTK